MGISGSKNGCTSVPYKAIFCGDIPLHRPYIGLIYGRYLQFRFLKWPLIKELDCFRQTTEVFQISLRGFHETRRFEGRFNHEDEEDEEEKDMGVSQNRADPQIMWWKHHQPSSSHHHEIIGGINLPFPVMGSLWHCLNHIWSFYDWNLWHYGGTPRNPQEL